MTAKEAKELTLEVWRYLAEHPAIIRKEDLPPGLWKRIDMKRNCPLCELYLLSRCRRCPLEICNKDSLYGTWFYAGSKTRRQAAAQKIVDAVEAWEPGDR